MHYIKFISKLFFRSEIIFSLIHVIFKILGNFQLIHVFKLEGFQQMSSINLRPALKFQSAKSIIVH